MPADHPVVLITGAGRRVGAATARQLHARGWTVLLHCRRSRDDADRLAAELNALRAGSAHVLVADLDDPSVITPLAEAAIAACGRLDALVNNASTFHPTPVGDITDADWDRLFGSNARAPLFLTQALAPALRASGRGAVVNITDIHADYPLAGHVVYCMAKAALAAMTKALAKDLAPAVRVNGVAPGAILWPEGEGEMDADLQREILRSIPLGREGGVDAIAETVTYLITGASYISGQIVAVDGGRSVWG
ncbi:pteridine reductase [Perlucidibaca piscinae]|uniref:pteridine reductase n=1 Tax=Perlucidibaca piscinae TaxID=392589 RepID=UPI0003B6CEAF|nr:pteridine reductase [Perlucidibaca piscinae]